MELQIKYADDDESNNKHSNAGSSDVSWII